MLRRDIFTTDRSLTRALSLLHSSPTGEKPPPPKTLAIVVNDPAEACHCLASLAALLTWATEEGIEHVSLYDQGGVIKASSSKLAELIVTATVTSSGRPPPCTYHLREVQANGKIRVVERFTCGGAATDRVKKGAKRVKPPAEASGGGGTTAAKGGLGRKATDCATSPATEMRTTVVDLLVGGDGSLALCEAARRWGEGEAGELETGATTPSQLEAWMATKGALLPAVDVTVVFGKHFHLAGYPPWQLHKTEIYHVQSLRCFDRKGLAEVLRKYSKVSQRFGK